MESRAIVRIALLAAVIAVLGMLPSIVLPIAMGVPITAQTLGVMLAGIILGPRHGALAVLLFLFVVLLGAPLLSGGRGGLGVLFGPSVGFLLGFVPAAFVSGLVMARLKDFAGVRGGAGCRDHGWHRGGVCLRRSRPDGDGADEFAAGSGCNRRVRAGRSFEGAGDRLRCGGVAPELSGCNRQPLMTTASTITATLSRHARGTPDRPAIVCDNHAVSWSDLDQAVNCLARHLAKVVPVGRGVALHLPNGPALVLLFLAACRTGRKCRSSTRPGRQRSRGSRSRHCRRELSRAATRRLPARRECWRLSILMVSSRPSRTRLAPVRRPRQLPSPIR